MVALSIALAFLGCLALAGFWRASSARVGVARESLALEGRRLDLETERVVRARELVELEARLAALEAAPKTGADFETRLSACERATKMRERFAPQAFPAP